VGWSASKRTWVVRALSIAPGGCVGRGLRQTHRRPCCGAHLAGHAPRRQTTPSGSPGCAFHKHPLGAAGQQFGEKKVSAKLQRLLAAVVSRRGVREIDVLTMATAIDEAHKIFASLFSPGTSLEVPLKPEVDLYICLYFTVVQVDYLQSAKCSLIIDEASLF
jgi:hypothetical protein